ncbi:hypothetical protein [Dyella sp. ASV21]|uniref:hypothetical protein n=1 Tax=Dyella sp. ASV21 TaxID=2795114 RepID=UPI0018EC6D45|nr:hypothetical protein [Dyella sp. ASV21]
MKRLILPVVIALGLLCVGQANAAVETYMIDLNGYAVIGFVGNTPEEFARAQQQANSWELQRHLLLKPQSIKAVAVDRSEGSAMSQVDVHSSIISVAQQQSL